ncbi:unnamed protein product [Pneumocystis jirovecii]|uniref:DNA polymerase alpha subunit B n=2 Tax=Pneumocystis jirovecii TaxID=42068 RepID=L0PCH6_PNEJI|nr:DNA-directed DNA polymerase alpha subunit POL12 [Pneumocystis jirovecii RU7]KTW28203.1 hypothetical protein T551_02622 [Pneumocystis jirovecii RU7]CCJ30096.1 unnamed protein product [Pneumocystis jirovecii]
MSQLNSNVLLKNELLDCFGSVIENSPEILMECLSILKLYSISPTELFYRWESWCLKMGNEPELVLENIQLFKRDMQYILEKRSNSKKKQSVYYKDYNNNDYSPDLVHESSESYKMQVFSNIMSNKFENSKKLSNFLDSSHSSGIPIGNNNYISITSFNISTNSGKVMETLNSHISFCNIRSDMDEKQKKISLIANFDPKKYSFKIMYQKLSEASEVLDDKIDMFTEELIKHYDLSQDDFGNPAHISHNEIVAVGRIICDSDSGGRLNTTSIILETSRRFGAGSRVLLHVDSLRSYALFPGQILGVKGINSSGSYFSVREFLMLPLLPFSATSLSDFKRYNSLLNGMPQKIFVASGPYTVNDNILFEPLTELCNKIQEEKPDVSIFIGPFLDIRHPLISTGNFNIPSLKDDIGSLDDLFKHCISSKLTRLNCLVIMIPHVQDACCKHAAWPQDCFNKKSLGLEKNIKCMPNPALFSLNEVIIGISSNDILMSLSKSEIIKSPLYSNALARLSYHVIQQRHFYPLFPGTAYESLIDGANLDIAFMGLGEFSDVLPDILILPSDLQYFAKIISDTVVINPGRLAKKQAFGTYAVMYIEPRDLKKVKSTGIDLNDVMLPHNLSERARVDIIRI